MSSKSSFLAVFSANDLQKVQKKIKLNLTSAAKDYIINNSFDEKYGARPIKRFVSRNLETLLATEIINDNIKFGETVNIDVKDDQLIIK